MKTRYLLSHLGCPLALTLSLPAADVTLTADDTLGTTSFNEAGSWSNALPPAPGNDYFTDEFLLRTPPAAPVDPLVEHVFAGDSLTVAPTTLFQLGKGLMFKGPGYTARIDNLTVDGGYIRHAEGETQFFVLEGDLAVEGDGLRFNVQGPLEIASSISGSAPITIDATAGTAARAVTFSAETNTFTGDIINNGRFVLAQTGRLNFIIGEAGVSNIVSGSGVLTDLNGTFFIDLSGASAGEGDSWTLVSAGGRDIFLESVTGPTGDWTIDGTAWTDPTSTYQFSEATGMLTVIPDDPNADDDNDLYTNIEEINAGTDPNDPFSSPDSDFDDLPDGFEVFYFGDHQTETLEVIIERESGDGDNDGDGYSNLAEFNAGTDPTDPAITPADTDGDGLIDSWEIFYFEDLTQSGGDHADADGASNFAEQNAGSDPEDSASTPTDTDGDGLADTEEALQPYMADSNTLHLWHLDEIEATPLMPAVDLGTDPVNLGGLANGATLWQPSLPAFNTALDTAANRGTTAGAVLSALPLADGPADDTPITLTGADGAFTFEAIVRIDFDPGVAPPAVNDMQIMSGENDATGRVFQFRVVPIGSTNHGGGPGPELEFINIGIPSFKTALPTGDDPDAVVQGNWYHVAVTYDGAEATPDNLKFFWTLMDESRVQAREILSAQMSADLPLANPDFAIGNEGRAFGGASDNFVGLIDEVRISDIARGAGGFYFQGDPAEDYAAWASANNVSGGPMDDDDDDGLSNDFERLFGLDPNSGGSVSPVVATLEPSTGQLVYTRRLPGLAGVTYEVWTSVDLVNWSQDPGATQTVTGTSGEVETVSVTLSPGLLDAPKRFVQIRTE